MNFRDSSKKLFKSIGYRGNQNDSITEEANVYLDEYVGNGNL